VVGKVTTLEHKIRDNTVERRAGIAVALLAGGESAEVRSSLWDYIVVELEFDSANRSCTEAPGQQLLNRLYTGFSPLNNSNSQGAVDTYHCWRRSRRRHCVGP
jgi:hypothetical protein